MKVTETKERRQDVHEQEKKRDVVHKIWIEYSDISFCQRRFTGQFLTKNDPPSHVETCEIPRSLPLALIYHVTQVDEREENEE